MKNADLSSAIVRYSAMNLLAMREHSIKELENKLLRKFDCQELVVSVVEQLAQDGLQSDIRFTEMFINMRIRQGKGPLLISFELKVRGISNEIVATLLDVADEIWQQVARKVYYKKFGENQVADIKLKAKQIRFLTARGFTAGNIHYALKNASLEYSRCTCLNKLKYKKFVIELISL